jgi:hypothetical protein
MKGARWAAAVVAIGFVTCHGLDRFTVTESTRSEIMGGGLVEQLLPALGLGFANFDITQNQTLQNQGVTKNQIDSVKMTRLTLTIIDPPSGQDFRFLDGLTFFVSAPGLERAMIASGGPFPSDARTVELTVEDVELAPYVVADRMDITTEARGRRPRQTTTVEATIVLDVDVNIGGAVCGG